MKLFPELSRPRVFFLWLCAFILSTAGFSEQARKPQIVQSTDPQLRISGFEQHLAMKQSSKFKDLKWQFLGPKNVSGRCTSIAAVTPKGKNYVVYVASASGGLWKTENEGTTWNPVFEQFPSTAFGAVAVSPSNQQIVWAGTGEANIFRSSQSGIGVYKSIDGGKSWQHMGLTGTYTIPRIVVHPSNPEVVYVAASGHEWTFNPDRGVFKTTDGGKTWTKVLYVNEKTGAIDLIMDPSNPDTLYAATWQRIRFKWNDPRNSPDYTGSGIYKTADGGNSWKAINSGLPEAKFRGRIGIDLCRANPNVVYAFIDDYELARPSTEEESDSYGRPSGGIIKGATLYRSDDKGESWKLVCPTTPEMTTYMERHSGTYGWVFGQMRVDPNDENTVYTMGLGLSVSTDGGKTLKEIGDMHGDHHGLWIDPDNSNYMVDVNDGGVVFSYDKGKTWRKFQDNLPVTQFFNINYDMGTPFRVYGSVQDWGSFRGVVDLSRGRDKIRTQDFENAPGGEGSHHAIDPDEANTVYSAGFYGTIERTDYTSGKSWYQATKMLLPKTYPDEPRLRGQWLAPFILSPHNPKIIYHGMQYLFRSLDRGDTWERISPDLTYNTKTEMGDIPYHALFAISESPLKYGLIYAGSDDGRVWVTKDGGRSWEEINAGLPYQKWVSRLAASAYDMGTVYMTQNGKRDDDFTPYVWKSMDFGKTWVNISKGIPLGPVNVIREDPVDKNILYVATDCGVYVTTDGAKTWNVLGANLPSAYVHDLIIHPRDNIIVIATHGRGTWALDANGVNNKDKRRPRFYFDED